MEITGQIIAVLPVQSGTSARGEWKKQEYVVEYDLSAQYPRKMLFNLWGDKIDQYGITQGQTYKISFDIDCREWNGRWFNDIRAWKVEPADGSAPSQPVQQPSSFQPVQASTPVPPAQPISEAASSEDDLPF